MKARQVRELSDEELEVRIRDTRKELFNLRFQHATGQLDNPHKLTMARREIARLLTVHIEREHAHVGGGEG
ncbi:MAG TPA: 50S ribosomal protein L29 [Thermoleophilia bacterium]|nr:50S ribosomal protein L29 [Thermoleophilia bacterium]